MIEVLSKLVTWAFPKKPEYVETFLTIEQDPDKTWVASLWGVDATHKQYLIRTAEHAFPGPAVFLVYDGYDTMELEPSFIRLPSGVQENCDERTYPEIAADLEDA